MAAVVKIPVVGKVDQRLVYAGGAAVVGIVGYAYLSGAGRDEPALVGVPETDFEPPTVVDSNIGGGGLDEPTPGLPQTNVEWLTMARETGAALGFSQTLLDAALPKYLGKQPISPTEAAAVAAIIAILGSPPSGSFPLIPTLPPTPPPHEPPTTTPKAKPGAIRSLRAAAVTRTRIDWQWARDPNATHYKVLVIIGPGNKVIRNTVVWARSGPPSGAVTPRYLLTGAAPGKPYRIMVRAERTGVGTGPYASIVSRTAR
jgi:hypothetical protein